MDNKQEKTNYGQELFSWIVPEYEKHERTKTWYIIALTISFFLLLFAFFTYNFLFAVIIIIVSLVTILHDGQNPAKVKFIITDEGIIIGRKFYDYDEIKNFSIVYKPRVEAKKLYFEFNNAVKHRLSVSLENMNPLLIRKTLLDYLKEDLERTDIPLSEALAKIFKL